jgi:multidrug efflux pump subunit AcrB
MGIVRFALKFPYTFYVLAALILFLGVSAIAVTPTDIFPQINIPVVSVIWQYTGLSTPEMEQRVTTYSQFAMSSSVNGIKDMEAQTLNGVSVQKIYFQPDVNLDLAIAQIVAATNAIRALMPAGIQPPIVVQYNASSVPVLQLSRSSDRLNEQKLYDYGLHSLRQAPVPGVTFPTPDGGKYRQIMVDIDPVKLQARGLKQSSRQRPTCIWISSPHTSRSPAEARWLLTSAWCISHRMPNPMIARTPQSISWSGSANTAPGKCFTTAGTGTRRKKTANDRS